MEESKYFNQLLAYKEIINTNKLYGFSLFDSRSSSTKIMTLYKLLGTDLSESQISKKLGYTSSDDINFIKLQKRLLKKLQSSLFFLDDSKSIFSDLGAKYYGMLKSTLQHRALTMLGKRNLSLDEIEKTIKKAENYEFPEFNLALVPDLIMYFGYINPDNRKYTHYQKVIDTSLNQYSLEVKVVKMYTEITREYFQKQNDTTQLISMLEKYIDIISKENTSLLTHKGLSSNFELLSLYYQLKKQYDDIIQLSKETLQVLSNKPYDTFLFRFMVYMDLAYAHKCKGDFQLSLDTIHIALAQHKNIDFNWFKLKSSEFNIYILLKEYEKAYLVLFDALKEQEKLNIEKIREEWNIKKAYIIFISNLGYINKKVIDEKPLSEFRLNRFLNDVPVYSKQKRSLNISILIIQMLFYLQEGKYNNYVDRMDALMQYTYRYLRNDDTLRSNCFMKMLLKIPDAHYHPVAVQRHVQKFYKKLIETPPPISDQTTEVEIIPYEDLWDMVLALLDKQK